MLLENTVDYLLSTMCYYHYLFIYFLTRGRSALLPSKSFQTVHFEVLVPVRKRDFFPKQMTALFYTYALTNAVESET